MKLIRNGIKPGQPVAALPGSREFRACASLVASNIIGTPVAIRLSNRHTQEVSSHIEAKYIIAQRRAMASEGYVLSPGSSQKPYRMASSQAISPINQNNNPFDTDMSASSFQMGVERASGRSEMESVAAIYIRKLPRHTNGEALRTMLLFAKDYIGADFVNSDSPSDQGYLSAIARFRSNGAAEEAKSMLNGKQNNKNEPPIQVEIYRLSPSGGLGPPSRNNFDMASNRAYSSSSTASSSGQPRPSRFNGTFQAISPPNAMPGLANGNTYSSAERSDVVSPMSNFFSPQSPIGQQASDRQRVTGKSVIGEDGIDDEPGDLLKDPLSYAKSDMSGQLSRHPTNPQLPTSRFAGLSLSTTTATSSPMSAFASTRSAAPVQSPTSAMSPNNLSNLGPNASYHLANQHYQRHNFPPVNPADQNPPCNTLYVGNLPIDTSEDELKAMFSKQRGYKRLCFRTKQNGPMCFVEFEDISFATKALNELYGHPLHNSVKGGIRLSFSKNPLGVRTGQPGGMGSQTPLSPSGPMPGVNGLGIQPFSTANGPPPGLAAPPGLHTSGSTMNGMMSPASMNNFGMNDINMGMPMRSPHTGPMTSGWSGQGAQYSDYMFGR